MEGHITHARWSSPRIQTPWTRWPIHARLSKGVAHAPGQHHYTIVPRKERLSFRIGSRLKWQGGHLSGIDDEVELQGRCAAGNGHEAVGPQDVASNLANLLQGGPASIDVPLVTKVFDEREEILVFQW